MNSKMILAALLFGWVSNVNAQTLDTAKEEKDVRAFQLSFVTPVGTNGMESAQYINRISFNILAGLSGGVEGAELGGFANITKGNVKGAQVAGFGNLVSEEMEGAQVAGFFNINRGYTDGVQVAGFTNVVADSASAIQVAGFTNVVRGSQQGVQAAGFSNTTAGSVTGVQLSGFGNMAVGNVKGAQVAGFMNVAAGDVEGAQIAGFVNVAKNVKGTQIGFINVCDSLTGGVPIGFLSIVKSGYRRFEVGGNEVLWANVSYKTGTERFYNIITAGASFENDELLWSFGYGVGTLVPVSDKMKINIDATGHSINRGSWTDGINLLSRLNLGLDYAVSERFSVFGGPAFNVMVSRQDAPEGNGYTYLDVAPYDFYDHTSSNGVNVKMWAGFSAGIRF